MTSWLLAIPYLLAAITVIAVAWAMGGFGRALLTRSLSPERLAQPGLALFLFPVRIALGLAVISFISSVIGIAGLFQPAIVFPPLIILLFLSLAIDRKFSRPTRPLRADVAIALRIWRDARSPERVLGALTTILFLLLCANALVGAMVPDMNQDPMWYHLSVTQQWLYDGRFKVYPNVMPSAYPLAVEAIYAVIFFITVDPVIPALLIACCGVLLLVGMASTALLVAHNETKPAATGWAMTAILGFWAPVVAHHGLVAPVQPKNDVLVMLWTFCGVMPLWIPLLIWRAVPPKAWWLISAILIGTACFGKPTVMAIAGIAWSGAVLVSGLTGRRNGRKFPLATLTRSAISLVVMAIAGLPWMIRGATSHGLPLFPAGQGLFETPAKFQPLMQEFNQLHTSATPLQQSWFESINVLWFRIIEALTSGEKNVFIYGAICLAGVISCRGRWRYFACVLLLQLLLVIIITQNVIFRLISPAYTLAAPLVAWLISQHAPSLQRRIRLAGAGIILLFIWTNVVAHQQRLANYITLNWNYHPVLSKKDIWQYAQTAEAGPTYLDFTRAQEAIHPDERVLLLGSTYPFYLNRNTLWNDEAVHEGGLAQAWSKMTTQQAMQFLIDERIDVILIHSDSDGNSTVHALLESGEIQPAPLPPPVSSKGWNLYRIHPSSHPE